MPEAGVFLIGDSASAVVCLMGEGSLIVDSGTFIIGEDSFNGVLAGDGSLIGTATCLTGEGSLIGAIACLSGEGSFVTDAACLSGEASLFKDINVMGLVCASGDNGIICTIDSRRG